MRIIPSLSRVLNHQEGLIWKKLLAEYIFKLQYSCCFGCLLANTLSFLPYFILPENNASFHFCSQLLVLLKFVCNVPHLALYWLTCEHEYNLLIIKTSSLHYF